MTVLELLTAILKAYPGANADALASFKSVFYARLQKHEGAALAAAHSDVFGSFRPTARQPFPIPANFEDHLPSGRIDLGKDGGPSIRLALEERAKRKERAYAEWKQTQGAKIRANRPAPVAAACTLLAIELAPDCKEPLRLTAQQITMCEQRALSTDRVKMFGPKKVDEAMWLAQLDEVRASWERKTDQPKVEKAA